MNNSFAPASSALVCISAAVLTACSSAPPKKLIVVQSLGYGDIGHVLEIGEKKTLLEVFQSVPGSDLGTFAAPGAYAQAAEAMNSVKPRKAVPDIPGYVVYQDSMRGDPALILQMPPATPEETRFLGLLDSLRHTCGKRPQSTFRVELEIHRRKSDSADIFAKLENKGSEAFALDSQAMLKAEKMQDLAGQGDQAEWKTWLSQPLPDSLRTLRPGASMRMGLGAASLAEGKTYYRVSVKAMSRRVFPEGVRLEAISRVDSLP